MNELKIKELRRQLPAKVLKPIDAKIKQSSPSPARKPEALSAKKSEQKLPQAQSQKILAPVEMQETKGIKPEEPEPQIQEQAETSAQPN